jgi:DNA-binding protein HU-beta
MEVDMSNSYTKADLVKKISNDAGIKLGDADSVLAAALTGIRSALTDGDKVTIVGFGTFSVSDRAGRTGLNPRTGQPIQIPASKSVRFKPGKALKSGVN